MKLLLPGLSSAFILRTTGTVRTNKTGFGLGVGFFPPGTPTRLRIQWFVKPDTTRQADFCAGYPEAALFSIADRLAQVPLELPVGGWLWNEGVQQTVTLSSVVDL